MIENKKNKDQLSFRLPIELKNRFMGAVKGKGGNATTILIAAIEDYVEEKADKGPSQVSRAPESSSLSLTGLSTEQKELLRACDWLIRSGDADLISILRTLVAAAPRRTVEGRKKSNVR